MKSPAAGSKEKLEKYFTDVREILKDVKPENLFNFDEINVGDDPGRIPSKYRNTPKNCLAIS